MNNKGQFLLYDMLLTVIIILIVLVSTTYILENINTPINENNYKESTYLLNIIEDEQLLSKLSIALDNNNTEEVTSIIEKIDYIINDTKYNYSLTDEKTNKTLINHNHTNKKIVSSRKTAHNHIYTLKLYYY